ncbi:MAG: hypothetical protein KatS3mg129_1170 [Leptospiraceae bacterium]|nr:MAG: hypothetical protein KatS3mg129_1170 [Leptospiraceae bacterium]
MTENQIKNYIKKEFKKIPDSKLLGIIYFGSRVKFTPEELKEISKNSDYDIGIIYDGEVPDFESPEDWDLFLWSKEKWLKGFALQVELARYAKILYDPEKIIHKQFKMIQEKILPHWLGYLKNF